MADDATDAFGKERAILPLKVDGAGGGVMLLIELIEEFGNFGF